MTIKECDMFYWEKAIDSGLFMIIETSETTIKYVYLSGGARGQTYLMMMREAARFISVGKLHKIGSDDGQDV